MGDPGLSRRKGELFRSDGNRDDAEKDNYHREWTHGEAFLRSLFLRFSGRLRWEMQIADHQKVKVYFA
jgi:hypothetical protein